MELLTLLEETTRICQELVLVLIEERRVLVNFDMEGLLSNNLRKEWLISKLFEKKRALRILQKNTYGVLPDQGCPLLPSELRLKWALLNQKLEEGFSETKMICSENLNLLTKSSEKLDLILGNLKALLFEPSTYSASGKKVDSQVSSRVVESRI